ncbi:MAG: DUF1501 domain-containing protein [Planctomycetia bacterium]|nr:DUF1501 domain-containing protein [Planctomycetia bacterium]
MRGNVSRRSFLAASGLGMGSMALACLLEQDHLLADDSSEHALRNAVYNDLQPRPGHIPAQARAVIQLYQEGGPSQVDLFDPKPELTRRHGQVHPQGVEGTGPTNKNILMASPFQFRPFGQCGTEFSELLPKLGAAADDLCLVRSMFTEHNNHPEAHAMMQSGKTFAGRPSVGAWVSYALGTENHNLPAYIVLRDPRGYGGNTKRSWTNGWLPALYQGVEFNSRGTPVQHLTPDEPIPPAAQRRNLQLLARLNAEHLRDFPGDSELESRISNYELAARMQLHATAALDLSGETAATRGLYGLDNPVTAEYGARCLMARRLVEAGVRFVQVHPPLEGNQWDHHGKIRESLQKKCDATDEPAAALIKDLKQRGLFGETIVMWTGEFGRLPTSENSDGRDHNRHAFSLLLAGGGFKGGLAYGATDEFGYRAIENRVSVTDLQATVLHQLGLDHTKLWYPRHGRRETLTDAAVTGAKVVRELLS